ncbi:beta-ketoacyl-[acyl-carrier-protein] synthase family protein [Geomonas sp. RF6]|uniref:beta-ketoacyl synthase N-terminal-like domain-containing protein n=1 Tax=Geomonas sp. RF6 TaxID=2897342 RepID=UPI001E580F14|nr:beta-ketoacyl synthase N-terminal-like domain-containing protein [Geomonas sp. RF6]UFS69368.1 beta-ketoacyl-[acyl-carrier-protein] synthase family protein [Geomonas sp. RF6]
MREVCICKTGVLTGFGAGVDALWEGSLCGATAVRPVERFATGRYLSSSASWIEGLERGAAASLLYPLLEMLLDGFGEVPRDALLVTATTKGSIDVLESLRDGAAPDAASLATKGVLEWLAARLGLSDPGMNINAACASSTLAVARAAALIAAGRAEAVLVVCMDLVSEFVFSGFSALQALDPERCRPFDRSRRGLSLGEGGAVLLLTSRERAAAEGLPVLATVAGWGAANDATHITAPARDACGLIQTVQQTLCRASIGAGDVAAVSAHGTGTVYNDQMELTAFRALFGERTLPVHSVKGAIGHTLGAAGGIEIALGVRCLQERLLPPTTGLLEPEAGGEEMVGATARPIAGSYLLSTNSGFGGVNAAVVLRREEP